MNKIIIALVVVVVGVLVGFNIFLFTEIKEIRGEQSNGLREMIGEFVVVKDNLLVIDNGNEVSGDFSNAMFYEEFSGEGVHKQHPTIFHLNLIPGDNVKLIFNEDVLLNVIKVVG
ncbi:MAG: hypothetical protein U9R08_07225 [Nanoarchaeota archaeon]|nr:hypothetical protein [Nanoarchaeota archaeon]